MGVINRGIKNAFRNSIRTVSIVFILAISVSMALVMLMSLKTVQSKIDSVKSSIGNTITVTPAGVRGFEGGGELLTEENVNAIKALANVEKTTEVISDRLQNGENTSLQSAIEPGSFGNRQQRQNQERYGGASETTGNNSERNAPPNLSMPIMVTGTNDLTVTSSLNVSKFDVTGSSFDPNTTDNVAMIGTELATKNSLSVGSTFTAYNKDIKVIGIFDGGNKFANTGVVMPIKTLQTLSGQSDQINSVIVQTSSIDTITSVQSAIKTALGDKVDVVSSQDSSDNAIAPLENIRTISLYSLFGALIAGAIIIFLTMVMIVRERRREIGVLKAIGASNLIVTVQFIVEALTLTIISSVVGIIGGIAFSNPILKVLVNNSSTASASPERLPGGPGRMMQLGVDGVQNAVSNLHATVGWEILVYGFLAAIAIAIIGSAIPAFIIAKVRPAEAMRAE